MHSEGPLHEPLAEVPPPGCRPGEPYGTGRTDLPSEPSAIDMDFAVSPLPQESQVSDVTVELRLPADSPFLGAEGAQSIRGSIAMRLPTGYEILEADPPFSFVYNPESAWQLVHWCDVALSTASPTILEIATRFPAAEASSDPDVTFWVSTNIWVEFVDTRLRRRYGDRIWVVAGKDGRPGAASKEGVSASDLDR